MKNRFDQLAKQVLAAALSGAGLAEVSRETSAEPQAVDVWFEPFADSSALARDLGALRLFAGECCLIEPFHQPPSVDDVSKCIAKQLAVRAERARGKDPPPPPPRLWIVSAGVPKTAISAFGFRPTTRTGYYDAAAGLRMHLVVLSALPKRRDTLLLRLMGAGRTLERALQDLMRLPPRAWERAIAEPELVRFRFEIAAMNPADRTEEEELIMNAQQMYDDLIRRTTEEGERKGKLEGKLEGKREVLLRQLQRRFGELPEWVATRVEAAGSDELEAWTERILSARDLDEMFG